MALTTYTAHSSPWWPPCFCANGCFDHFGIKLFLHINPETNRTRYSTTCGPSIVLTSNKQLFWAPHIPKRSLYSYCTFLCASNMASPLNECAHKYLSVCSCSLCLDPTAPLYCFQPQGRTFRRLFRQGRARVPKVKTTDDPQVVL